MGKIVRAIINPKLLVWARESAGFDLARAAKKLTIEVDRLKEWESGKLEPTMNQLRKAASVYKRPFAAFYLKAPPRVSPAIRDFRRLPDEGREESSPALLLEIRKARLRKNVAEELADLTNYETIPFTRTANLSEDLDLLAKDLRNYLGITLSNQFRWRDHYKALNNWKSAIEKRGTLVFHASRIDVKIMRGFSISSRRFPVIVVNAKDSPRGRIFTLLHELGHLLIENAGLCNLREDQPNSPENQRVERFCNGLAGRVLVPGDILAREPLVVHKKDPERWDEAELRELADKFKVSTEVLLRRLVIIGKASQELYRRKRAEFLAIIERQRDETPKFSRYLGRVIRENGVPYIELVLSAYHQDKITSTKVSDYLGINLKHLSDIEVEVLGKGRDKVR